MIQFNLSLQKEIQFIPRNNDKQGKLKKGKRNESQGEIKDKSQVPSLFFNQTKESKNSGRYAASAVPQPRVDSNFSIKLHDLDEISSIDSDFYDSYEYAAFFYF